VRLNISKKNNNIIIGKVKTHGRASHFQKKTNNIMKTFKKVLSTLLFLITVTLLTLNLSAQTPPPPNGGGDPGSGNTPVGGGAPIAGGIGILLVLGAAYGGKKVWDFVTIGK
jgi:hypothetical protein